MTIGFSIAFARRYVHEQLAPKRKVLIIPAARGGTSILKWLGQIPYPETLDANGQNVGLYADALKRTKAVLALPGKNRVVAFLWHQGEADVDRKINGQYPMSPTIYQTKLSTLIRKIRTDLPSSPAYPIVAGKLAPSWLSGSTKLALKNQIEAAIVRVLSADAKGGVVSSGSLQANYPSFTSETGEANHFTSASQVTLGARYYGLWRQLNGL
jgi:hypothetical protein